MFETSMVEKEKSFEEIARSNFALWNEALKTKRPEAVAAFYAADVTFLPTVSGDFKIGREAAEGYFEHFLLKNPTGEVVKEAIQPLGPDCYLHSGHYNFSLGPDDDKHLAEARFSYVWQKNQQGEWRIIHHHSSLKPN